LRCASTGGGCPRQGRVEAYGESLYGKRFADRHLWLQAEGALDKAWDATDVAKKTRVKLGGGFYCGQIEVEGIKCARHPRTNPNPLASPTPNQVLHVQRLLHELTPLLTLTRYYTFNAFFMTMRGKFTVRESRS
jgi:hypothetical protein